MIGFVLFSLRRAGQGFLRNAVISLAPTGTVGPMVLVVAGVLVNLIGPAAGARVREGDDGPDADAAVGLLDHPDRPCRGPRVRRAEGRGRRGRQPERLAQ